MKIIKLQPERRGLSPNTIMYLGITGFFVGIITAMIAVIDAMGDHSIWAKDGWNIARVMLDCCCFISGFACSFFSMQKAML